MDPGPLEIRKPKAKLRTTQRKFRSVGASKGRTRVQRFVVGKAGFEPATSASRTLFQGFLALVGVWLHCPNLVPDLRRRWLALVIGWRRKSISRGPTAARGVDHRKISRIHSDSAGYGRPLPSLSLEFVSFCVEHNHCDVVSMGREPNEESIVHAESFGGIIDPSVELGTVV